MLARIRGWTRSHSSDGYELLPMPHALTLSIPSRQRPRTCHISVRLLCYLLPAVILGLSLLVYSLVHTHTWRSRLLAYFYTPQPAPPLYARFRAAEAALPQHHVDNPFANGQKYLYASSNTYWLGWGNHMEDIVLTAHLAQLANRTHVFNDYMWDVDGPAYTRFENKNWIPNKIPLSAIASGPIVGAKSTGNITVPLAIHKDHFRKICPRPSVIHVEDVEWIAVKGKDYDPYKVTQTYLEYLSKLDDPCVEIVGRPGHTTFSIHVFDNMRMHSLWPTLSISPYVTQFDWSPLAYSALATNRHLFLPPASSPDAPIPPRFDGLLVLQLRRGDFVEHCHRLQGWRTGFNAYNRFPGFPDPWIDPWAPGGGLAPDEIDAVYMRRCWPSAADIVRKVDAVRRSAAGAGLDSVYIMTNGSDEWVAGLEAVLGRMFAWARVASSRDALWTWEEKFVSQAMDMLVAERAQVFIGNGFSSMASNVAMLRMAKGFTPDSTTMW